MNLQDIPVWYATTWSADDPVYLKPYFGVEVRCEYRKNTANINISRRYRLVLKMFQSPPSPYVEIVGVYDGADFSEDRPQGVEITPVTESLLKAIQLDSLCDNIKRAMQDREKLVLYYNPGLQAFSRHEESRACFAKRLKREIVGLFSDDLWKLREYYLTQLQRVEKSASKQAIAAKMWLENPFVLEFLYGKSFEYPSHLPKPLSKKTQEKSSLPRFEVALLEEDLLEKLYDLKDRMDNLLDKTVEYELKPQLDGIYVEHIRILYLARAYE